MFCDDWSMEDEQVNPQEIWSAIRYLDPDDKDTDTVGHTATTVAFLALVIIAWALCWGLLWLKVRQP
jgi:hypothetical protein